MNTIDREGPPDGDFASYVERLSGNARAPGRVEALGESAKRRSRAGERAAREPATGQPTAWGSATPPSPPSHGNMVDEAREALRRATGHAAARRAAGANQATEALRAAGRSVALRLSRWFAIGGIALIAAAVLELIPALSPLPGFALLMLSFVLRRLATRS